MYVAHTNPLPEIAVIITLPKCNNCGLSKVHTYNGSLIIRLWGETSSYGIPQNTSCALGGFNTISFAA